MEITLKTISLKDYLENNSLIISSEELVKDVINQNIPLEIKEKLEKQIKENIVCSNMSYHNYYLKETNKNVNTILNSIKKVVINKNKEKLEENLQKILDDKKENLYYIKYNLPYKKFITEEYPEFLIILNKKNMFYKENPKKN